MVEPDFPKTNELEDTVRNLREENAKLIQLLRSQGLILDPSNNKTTDPPPNQQESSNITFDHSDLTLTTNSITTTNQINHQHVNNHGSTNQQNYGGQTVHGNQSNITPNFNTVIQTTTQPFVQNNSNTLVQNNTNLIQPINLVNFNNVSLDSLQSFFASQNSVVYLSQSSSSSTTTTTTTTTSSSSSNCNVNESISSNILPSISSEQQQHQISIRPKPSLIHQHQELVPVIPKIKTEQYENMTRQLSSSSNTDTTNLLDNDSNDFKNKHPRPIRPKPSSRLNSLQVYAPVSETKSSSSSSSTTTTTSNVLTPSSYNNNNSPTVSLFSSPTCLSPTNYLSQSSSIDHQIDLPPQLLHSKSLDISVPSTTTDSSLTSLPTNKKSNKNRIRNRKKPSASSVIVSSTNPTLIPIAPNLGRPLAPAPSNTQRVVTSNNPITKRSTTNKKRTSKTLVQYHSESLLQQSSSPTNTFAESISGLLENFDQELIASNFLTETTNTTTTSNLLSDENNSIISSNTNIIRTLDHIDLRHIVNGAIQRQESYHSTTTASMPTMDEFNDRLEHDTGITNHITQDYNVENEQITSFMSEEDMRLVEMNFDENTFLKQFDLEDAGIKLSVHSDQNLFANILTNNNHDLIQLQQINERSIQPPTAPPPPPTPTPSLMYPGSSLINNNVFTTVVPLGLQKQSSLSNTFISNTNASSFLPEEGVQLTARHIEPSQVATYESVKYQDILDDLVMVTDQDALRHAQVAAENDPSVVSTDFSFALLEATNEIIKGTNIQLVEQVPTAFNDLQYFYPIEQEQELLQKQLESCQEKEQEMSIDHQQPIVILEKLQSEILESTKHVLDDSIINTSITDLSSILQFEPTHSPSPHNTSSIEMSTPIRPRKTKNHSSSLKSPVDFDSLLPASNLYNNNNHPVSSYSPISDTLGLSSNSLRQQIQETTESPTTVSSKPCILFEPISSPSNPSSPLKSSHNEMIIDSGCLNELNNDKGDLMNTTDDDIEDLLRDTPGDPYEIIENQGQTFLKTDVIVDNLDHLIEQIEPSTTNSKDIQISERTFSRYKQMYRLNVKREQEVVTIKPPEQLLTIPPVKLKLLSIYPEKSSRKKKKRKTSSSSPSPTPPPPPKQIDNEPTIERPPLRITIRTKLAPPPPPPSLEIPSEEKTENKKIRKTKKKKSHHHHHHHKKKTIADQLETEYAGLTRFERPLAQLYRQQSPPTPDETLPKDEMHTSPPPPPLPELQSSNTFHSGFIIDEQTPPSSITSIEHKQSPPPLLINQTKTEKLKINYSHLFNYDNHHDHQNNNTYITPPPEIDLNLQHQQQQKTNSYENFCQFSNSPDKKKRYHRKSSVTSSTSSKSLTNTDYAIDTQALEPVSPTPLSTSKQKHSQNQSASSSAAANYNDISPPYFEHQQPRQGKDHHSKKSSSSNRSSRTAAPQIYQPPPPRSLPNHNYRPPQEPPLLPPILPQPPPIHMDPYAQSYHHFAPRAAQPPPPPFFNFPFPHPFLNPHATSAPPHFHHPSMKYHHHHHPSHGYPTHQQQFPYHPHLQRQQQYNNSNYMSSRDHHSFDR